MTTIKPAFLFLPAFLLFACDEPPPLAEIDTPTEGKVALSIDENIRPLADQLVDAFEYSYPEAFLIQSYKPESGVMQELYDDSSQLAVMTRPLDTAEVRWFAAKTYTVEQIKIASDAVVLLVNRENPDSVFTVDQVRRIISGQDTLWSQLRPGSTLGRIDVVFDNGTSSNLRYLSDTLLDGKAPGKNCFAVSSNDTAVAYVNAHPNAIGVVGLNWLGDKDSDSDQALLSQVTVAAVGKDTATATRPHQSALVTGQYPFTRGIWIIKIGKRRGLGTGFATFALGDRGQLIVQHAGLAPAAPAERKVEITIE